MSILWKEITVNLEKEINIQITAKCPLKCKFCARSWIPEKDLNSIQQTPTMGINTFKLVVEECIKAGKTIFGLTPRMGDLFTDKDIMEKLRYLNDHPKVEYFFFATNLINISGEQIQEILTFKKLYLEISLYGYTKEMFLDVTGKDLYEIFLKNLNLLSFFMRNEKYPNIKFYVRWGREKIENPLKRILLQLEIINSSSVCYDEIDNFNFGGLIPEGSLENEHPSCNKKGICPTAYTGCILPNGDYNLCYMNDVYNALTIGNIFVTSLSDLLKSDKRKHILDNMKNNVYESICIKCNEKW